jgi:hypothetical protein
MDIGVRHSGLSAISLDGKTYGFRHLGYDGRPFLYWTSTIDFLSGKINPDKPADATNSLLLSQMRIPTLNTNFFASPDLDATLVVTRPTPTDRRITELVLSVEYSYTPI